MDKKRIEIIITSILILMLIFAWANSIKVLDKKLKQKAKPQAMSYLAKKEASLTEPNKDKWKEEEGLDFARSPFSGKRYGDEEVVDFKISGIIWDEVNPQVIINGKISKVGDSVEGFVVEKIEKQKVTLFKGKRKIELNI